MISGTQQVEKTEARRGPELPTEPEPGVKTPRAIRVVVDLLVDEDIWAEKKQEGSTDKYLVSEVRKTLYLQGAGLWFDSEIQEVKILDEGGD
jgi:hypothetical protein